MSSKRNTAQRQLILGAVKELNTHPTAEQVFEYVSRLRPSIGKATVYRNLSQMAESGEISNVGSFSGSTHYDHNCHAHHHFACKSCKRIFDIEGDFSDVCDRVEQTDGFDITSFDITFSGLCWECQKKT